jgi:hypothetical protein
MWSQLIRVVGMSKGALVVGVAASAAMVSNAEFSNAPSHNELPSATPSALVSATPATTRPANSPSSLTSPKISNVPAVQLPVEAPPASPNTDQPKATSPKAGSAMAHGELPAVVKECVEKYLAIREQGDSAPAADRQSVGEVCKAALTATGLSPADFWAKFALNDDHKTEPKTEPKTGGLDASIKECVAQYLAGTADQSDACRNAIAASGLTPQEFWTKFGPYADHAKDGLSPEALHLAQECATKYSAHAADATVTCKRAIELSGLTSAEFAAKFHLTTDAKPNSEPKSPPVNTTKPSVTLKPVTTTADAAKLVAKCLDLYANVKSTGDTKAVSEACGAAIRANGMTSAEFWTKYHPTTN